MAGKSESDFENNEFLLAEIARGCKRAETALVSRFSNTLRFILSRKCDDPHLVADIVQDTLLVVITKARSEEINSSEALGAFVRQTGVNLMLAHFRKETRRATDTVGEQAIEIQDLNSDVANALQSKQALELVQEIMDEMSVERDKDLIVSYFVKNESKSEICERLELTPAHFDRVLYRSRARLKEQLKRKFGDVSLFN